MWNLDVYVAKAVKVNVRMQVFNIAKFHAVLLFIN
jgi:hypothetical protein